MSTADHPKTILMILQSDYPPDIRLTKEIKALTAAGHRVLLLCNNAKHLPQFERVDGAHVYRLPAFTALSASLQKLIRLPLFTSPLWYFKAAHLIKQHSVDVLHVHDLPLAPLAVALGKRFRKPVVYDMHENYPAAMAEWSKRGGLKQKILRNPKLAELLNNYVLQRAAKIIVVVEEQRDNLLQQGLPSASVHVVNNTVDMDAFLSFEIKPEIVRTFENNFTILYIGSFSTERGLETAIAAMQRIQPEIPSAQLLLVGDGKNTHDLKQLALTLGVQDQVTFVGWVPFDDVRSYMSAADVCIIPQPSNPANDTTQPHKLFQYMLMEKAVLTSDAKPLKRIVQECQSGESFKSEDPADFARAVVTLHSSSINFGENGKRAVEGKYNWRTTSQELLRLYSELTTD
mgnify:CR=1 FL=1